MACSLLLYHWGVTLADGPYIDAIYEASKSHNYSLRAAIEAIVAHPEFGRK
jgi:hypothetical protein